MYVVLLTEKIVVEQLVLKDQRTTRITTHEKVSRLTDEGTNVRRFHPFIGRKGP
jgi:hypothetical protein